MTTQKNSRVEKMTPHALSKNARQLLRSSGTMLSFQTSLGVLGIGEATNKQSFPEDALQSYYLMDSQRRHIGKVWTCDRVARARRKHHFIALSSRSTGTDIDGAVAGLYIPRSSDDEGNYSDDPSHSWTVTNVMLVEWSGDVAFRVALGQVISRAWSWDKRTTRLVFLG